ncbi:toll/interleukin-1 receptor domain-containing protein [uncultured Sphaerochaeta sp.]|uniref:toll/interleukin-1 receptor domain-containing protein n=1 Tax=uncultured Sphaerochaeta sp. TaxID=886478 RepID=UPI002A0A91EC|nr:toll/interleukin-1 receptor domain-containing protein [uncultured Sphaerochaeta sp.]
MLPENIEEYKAPKVFISYSHDSEEHAGWVLKLSNRLRQNGIDVILDAYTPLGSDLALFMEQGLNAAHRVICICSEPYNIKANAGKAGVGYEKRIISQELMQDSTIAWVIPVIRKNPSEKKTPTFLSSIKYISFENDLEFPQKYYELLQDLHQQKKIPPLGNNPFANMENIVSKIYTMNQITASLASSVIDSAVVEFNYLSNSNIYTFGTGDFEFITQWSNASPDCIHAYKDNVYAIALSPEDVITDNFNIYDYDFSSRTRTPRIGESVIWINRKGRVLITKIIDIHYENTLKHYLKVEYQILKLSESLGI